MEEKMKKVPLFLAPMAGAGDRAFREICAPFGVDFFCTEMISAKALVFGDKKTSALMDAGEVATPLRVQLFGSDPNFLAKAAAIVAEKETFCGIDLNFGCPVPKIAGNGEGSALMRDVKKCAEIVSAVRCASPLPVSVKIRAGWDEESLNAPEVALACQEAGADMICVHGRTRMDFYRDGTVKPQIIRKVKEAVSIPVIGNGDIVSGESAKKMLLETGCDGLMIGRAAVGAPWVFASIRAALEGREEPFVDRKEVIREHLRLAFRYKPESAGREMRMHMAKYLKGFRGAASLRDRSGKAVRIEDYFELVDQLQ